MPLHIMHRRWDNRRADDFARSLLRLTRARRPPMLCAMDGTSLTIVLPCFNEAANIERTVRDCAAWMQQRTISGEIIAVDDGSTDRTSAILEQLRMQIPSLRMVRHEHNQGYGIAVRSGIDAARTEIVAFMDSDGQFCARDFDLLLPHLDTFPFAAGRRRRRADSFTRNMLGKVLGLMNWIALGLWVRDVNCGMKVMCRDLWPAIRPTHGVEKLFNTEMFLRLKENGIAWATVDVPHFPRRAGSPTGAKLSVILRMFSELRGLRRVRSSLRAAHERSS
ncbi:glycosyltransferase family 2 protein [Candidatus Peregrinibacteria bacterium]|nr:glycosyltransferase family 2 protein [Candidatus Peregrinibacteria bacterium]